MRKIISSLVAIFIVVVFSSCQKMILNSMGVLDRSVTTRKMKNSSQEVIFISMHHVGKHDFYLDVKNKVDSLRHLGFIFYYERVKRTMYPDSLSNDTLRRKFRKILGLDVLSPKMKTGYIDTLGSTSVGLNSKMVEKYQLVNQPGLKQLGLDTLKDIWADASIRELMESFERKFGTLVLDECDLKTNFDEKYSCSKYNNKEGKKFILADYRNQIVARKVLSDRHPKIAILYGAKHFTGILKELQQKDSTWKSY
jgi:hypothetical protein